MGGFRWRLLSADRGVRAPVPPGTGSAEPGSVGTDPGITNSTTGNGGVNLNSGRSTINPGGVNPNLQQTPGCTGATGTDTGSLGDACPQ